MEDNEIKPGVDIIVVNWRTPDLLSDFIDSYAMNPPATEHDLWIFNVEALKDDIIVGEQAADEFNAHHLISGSNIGYSGAVNKTAKLCNREVLAIFNSDIILSAGSIDECYYALVENPEWAALGPKQVNLEGKITHAGIFGENTSPRHRGWKEQDNGQYDDVLEATSISGSAYFVKNEIWREMADCSLYSDNFPEADGAFLPTPHFYEETWLSYHLRAHGYKVIYFGDVKIVHLWHQSSDPKSKEIYEKMITSRGMFRNACEFHSIECD